MMPRRTTLLTTLLIPTSGTVSVLGLDAVRDASRLRKRIGFVFGGERGLYYRLSGADNLRYFAELYGVAPREIGPRVVELLALVGMTDRADERVEGYSRGMKQRLCGEGRAQGPSNRPEVMDVRRELDRGQDASPVQQTVGRRRTQDRQQKNIVALVRLLSRAACRW